MTKNFKKIFGGIFLLWLILVIFAAAFYWPQIKESFSALTGRREAGVSVASAVSAARPGAAGSILAGGNPKEGFLWVDPQREPIGQYIVTLGEAHGAFPGKNLMVYDGNDELGEVTVERALETVSYVRPAKASVDLSQNPGGYYRVVMK
ncbi:MAG: hypothetical protein HZA29_00755 [Candidatus Omnitrophica bacterium]|nr:hypothetical protein [Candidatus Omnitrophota bacterium]